MQATQTTFDIQTFTLSNTHYHGVYGEDFLTFGKFDDSADVDNEATLLQIFEDSNDAVVDRHYFKFDNGQVSYGRAVDVDRVDAEVEHAIEQTPLSSAVADSWSETLFYGVGNSKM